MPGEPDIVQWIHAARKGSREALGRLLDACKKYLHHVAEDELGPRLRNKIAPSSLVQAAYQDACASFREQFRGETKEELQGWLAKILRHNLLNEVRKVKTLKRDIQREHSLEGQEGDLVAPDPSPCAQLIARELVEAVDRATDQLYEDHRQVILLRFREKLPWKEIGARIGRSPEAAQQLWSRALIQMKRLLEPSNGTG